MSTHIRRAVAALLTGLLTAAASVGCAAADSSNPDSPLVAVYRGEAACDGCPETIAQRLRASFAGAEVVFTLYRLPGVDDAEFDRDADMVRADLARLRTQVETNRA